MPFLAFWDKDFPVVMKSFKVNLNVCFWPSSFRMSNRFFTSVGALKSMSFFSAFVSAYIGIACPREYTGFDAAITRSPVDGDVCTELIPADIAAHGSGGA